MSSLGNQLSSFSMSEEEEAFVHAWCLRSSSIFPYVLDAAVQLGVFDILAKAAGSYGDAHLSSNQIASQLHANNPDAPSLLEHMLRLLACYGLVTCVSRKLDGEGEGDDEEGNYKVEKLYGLALPGKAFVNDDNGGSLAAFTPSKHDIEGWKGFTIEIIRLLKTAKKLQ